MTKSSGQPRLPAAAESLLQRWQNESFPHDERASRAADAALARIASGDKGKESISELVVAPLPEEPGESAAAVRPSVAAPVAQNVEDLDLIGESLTLSSRGRRSVVPRSTPVPPSGGSQPRAMPHGPNEAVATSESAQATPSATPGTPRQRVPGVAGAPSFASGQVRLPAAAARRHPREQYLLGAGIGLAGILILTGVWLLVGRPRPTAVSAASSPRAAAGMVAKATAPGSPVAPAAEPAAPAPGTNTSPARDEGVVDPEQLALEGQGRAPVPEGAVARAAGPAPAAAPAAAPAQVPAALPAKPMPSWLKAAAGVDSPEPTTAQNPPSAPTAEAEQVAPEAQPTEPEGPTAGMKPADQNPAVTSLEEQPSSGAVQAALGKCLPAARQCVAGGEPVTAQVTFRGSTGKVLSVAIMGGAKDQTAASCIRAALGVAQVSPFAKPTYSATTTITP